MAEEKVFRYEGQEGDVTWDGRLCIHVGECSRAEGELFVAGRKPWCQPDLGGDREQIVQIVKRCPTGALAYEENQQAVPEQPEPVNTIAVANNGPLYATGQLEIDGADPEQASLKYRAALCRCGQSKNKPFCDNAHEDANFRDRGAIGRTGTALESEGGPLVVKRAPNGPLLVSGNLRIIGPNGRVAWTGKKAALCRCGQSKNKPFCDGAHTAAGFEAE